MLAALPVRNEQQVPGQLIASQKHPHQMEEHERQEGVACRFVHFGKEALVLLIFVFSARFVAFFMPVFTAGADGLANKRATRAPKAM